MLTRRIHVSEELVYGTIGFVKSIKKNINDKNDIQEIQFFLSLGSFYTIEKNSEKCEAIDKTFVTRKLFLISTSYAIIV